MADRYRPPDRRPPALGPYQTAPPPPMRRFGQPNGVDHYSPAQNSFSFRPDQYRHTAPQYPDRPRDFRPPPPRRPAQGPPRGPRGQAPRGGGRFPGRDRPFRPRFATSERPLLHFKRGSTPERLQGMNSEGAGTTYLNPDMLSDSEEQSMDESEPEDEGTSGTKRVKLAEPADDGPKWSNPELYTAIPPVEDASERKRRDVVKLIRKARVAAAQDKAPVKPLEGDDFISFGFEDEEENASTAYSPPPPPPPALHSTDNLLANQTTPLNTLPATNGLPNKPPTPVVRLPTVETVASRLQEQGTKRKRSPSDEGGRFQPPRPKQIGRGGVVDGRILTDWEEQSDIDPTPWIRTDHRSTENCGFRLHKEICDFFEFAKPKPYEHRFRQDLLNRLGDFIASFSGHSCTIHAFGSFAAELYLPNSDMDVVAVSARYFATRQPQFIQTKNQMYRLARALEFRNLAMSGSTEVISGAKVPIIKFVDPLTRLNIDLSFENDTGITANQTFHSWKSEYPAMPVLVTLIKQFLMMRGLNNVANGGIGGFSVTCLVVSLLQNLPRVQLGHVRPEQHLGEMLLEFFDFYGRQLDVSRTALRMSPPGLVDKASVPYLDLTNPRKAGRLCIIDPNRADNDISGGTRQIDLILRRFAEAHEDLLYAMRNAHNSSSLLRCIIGGNYNDFLWHRWHLAQLRDTSEDFTSYNAISVG